MFGGLDNDTMDGGEGNDTLSGDGGNDTINGGMGNDRIFAGSGDDVITYVIGEGSDTVYGEKGVDTLRLEMSSADLPGVRDEILEFADWLANEVSNAGGEVGHGNLIAGATYKFSFGLSVNMVENLEIIVDGETRTLQSLLNSPPVVDEVQELAALEDEAISGSIAATDPDGDTLSYQLIAGPDNGELSFNTDTGEFTYTPEANYSGRDAFSVLVSDGQGGTTQQRVDLSIEARADAATLAVSATSESSGTIMGTDGNDIIRANKMASSDQLIHALNIEAGVTDTDGSETLQVAIAGVPAGSELSAGELQEDGTWLLNAEELAGLSLKLAAPGEVTLQISAISTEANGHQAVTTQALTLGGGSGSDDNFIDAGTGNDFVRAGRGNDVVIGGEGNDFLFGGRGIDTLDYSTADSSTWVNLKTHSALGNDSGRDYVRGFENVKGSDYNDAIIGDGRANVIYGGKGNDFISGGRGADTLSGGDGGDTFAFHISDVISGRKHHGVDTISDFEEFDTLDFGRLVSGRNPADRIVTTETEQGTMVSVDFGKRGVVDVVMLEGVEDFDISSIDFGKSGPNVKGNAFGRHFIEYQTHSDDAGLGHSDGMDLFA